MKIPRIDAVQAAAINSPKISPKTSSRHGGASTARTNRTPRGFTIGGKYSFKNPSESVPGPGSYEVDLPIIKKQGPAYTMTGKINDKPSQTPGPGAYDLYEGAATARSPAFTFGVKPGTTVITTPGPAEYSPRTSSKSTIAFTMGKRIPKKGNTYPGPGAYSIEPEPPPVKPHTSLMMMRKSAAILAQEKQHQLQDSKKILDQLHVQLQPDQQQDSHKQYHHHHQEQKQQSHIPQQIKFRPASQLEAWSEGTRGTPLVWTKGSKFRSPSCSPVPSRPAALRGGSPSSSPTPTNGLGSVAGSISGSSPSSTPTPNSFIRAPDFSLTLPRSESACSNYPGPGTYNTSATNITTSTPPSFTIAPRRVGLSREPSPGPGYYAPKMSAPGFKVAGKRYTTSNLRAHSMSPRPSNHGPAFTLGGLTQKPGKDPVPGPGSYEVLKAGSTSPSYTMGDRVTKNNFAAQLPGPGAYGHDDRTKTDGPAYTMTGRFSPIPPSGTKAPGPGAYAVVTTDTAPAFTFGKRTSPTLKDKTPGPGQYHNSNSKSPPVRSPARSPSPAAQSIVSKQVSVAATGGATSPVGGIASASAAGNPGPGAYTIPQKPSSPCFTMGHKIPEPSPPPVPGPGHYNLKTKPAGPVYSLTSKSLMVSSNTTPGPGTYTTSQEMGKGQPAITMSGRISPPLGVVDLPAPGDYDHHSTASKQATSIRSRIDIPPAENIQFPGPGTYPQQTQPEGPYFTMGTKIVPFVLGNFPPGPGAYDVEPYGPQGPAFTIRSRPPPPPITTADNPGPGAYIVRNGETGKDLPGFTLTGRPKSPLPERTPGPGAYQICS